MYSSRAGEKLAYAINSFGIKVEEKVCADLGCSTGGFTSCLLESGAKKVYSVDTGYGVLDYKLRINPKVVVLERQNALFVNLPELVDFISIDVGWTPQRLILPHALSLLKPEGIIISLLKPHYESKRPHLEEVESEKIKELVLEDLAKNNIVPINVIKSPIKGEKAGNVEYLLLLEKVL